MISFGAVRPLDLHGRVVLPRDLRQCFCINADDLMEIYTHQNMIILKKTPKACVFCNSTKNIIEYKGKHICSACFDELTEKE